MGFFGRLLGREPNLLKLLTAKIVADEDHNYFVSFYSHHPELQLSEHVRLVLHYYAKMLFVFDPKSAENARHLNTFMASLLSKRLAANSDVFRAADIDDTARVVSSIPAKHPREFMANLFFVSAAFRHITTDIPKNAYTQQMVFSVFALLQATLSKIDEKCIDVLDCSLRHMNAAYDSGENYSDPQSLAAIPNQAYIDSVMNMPR